MEKTPKGFKKPQDTDLADLRVFVGDNMDLLDGIITLIENRLKALEDGVTTPPDTTAPNNVTNLTYSNATTSSVLLSWNASSSSDVIGYEIYYGQSVVATTSATSYTVTGLSPGTSFTMMVKAKDNAGNISSGASVTFSTLTPADTTPPQNVTGLSVGSITQTSLTLTWVASSSSDVSSYDVYRGSTLLSNVTGNSYNVSGLTANTQYTFSVRAKDGAGNVASGVSVQATTLAEVVVPSEPWTYDFVAPQATGTFILTSLPDWTHTVTTEDIYGANLDGANAKVKLYTLGVVDGTKDAPQELPRDGFDSFTAPSMHGAFQFDAELQQIIFQSGAMNPYYFRLVKLA